MKKKRKLKKGIKLSLFTILFFAVCATFYSLVANKSSEMLSAMDDFTFVNDYIFDNYSPVMNSDEESLIRPYSSENISLYRNYYDKDATSEEQEKSIVLSDGTYIQNSGIDYKSNESFDVVSSLSGTVTNITKDTLLGDTIEIKSSDNVVVTYQSLSDVKVKKGDQINQGEVIAKSGKCSINADVENGLHYEVYINGKPINPEKYYDKVIKEANK